MNNELILFFNIILKVSGKIEIVKQSHETLLKINIFQNLTQYLVYFKKYIKIILNIRQIMEILILLQYCFYFSKDYTKVNFRLLIIQPQIIGKK